MLLEAAEKFRSARDFERGDAMVMNALGDTLVALADATLEAAAKQAQLHQALEEGFGAALHIDRRHPDALVGSAEVQLQLGRCKFPTHIVSCFELSPSAFIIILRLLIKCQHLCRLTN